MARETAAEVDHAAAEWAARVDRGLSPSEEAEFEAWRLGDVRRSGAYGLMRAIALRSERAVALGPQYTPQEFQTAPEPARPSRRALISAGGSAAAVLAGAVWVGASMLTQPRRYQTRKGEIRQIALEDGSVITLNTASRLEVRFDKRRRAIQLDDGEALFDVAHDKQRPFVVSAGLTQIRAVGTSFTVSRLEDQPVEVLVREGIVEVTGGTSATAQPVRLGANSRALATPRPSPSGGPPLLVSTVPVSELQRQLAWRDGKIALEGQTLGWAAAEFDRYSDTKIIVDDPRLAKEGVIGLYQANDPVGFSQSIALSLNARTEIDDGAIHILR